METSSRNSCYHQGRVYPSGSHVHGEVQGMVCRDGEWQDLEEKSSDTEPSLAYNYH